MKWSLLLVPLSLCQATIKGISLYGLETESKNFVCSWYKPVDYYIPRLQQLGFNSLRIPYSHEYVLGNNFQNLDVAISTSKQHNISVMLDLHRTWSNKQNAYPIEFISLEQYIETWLIVLRRYKDFDNVIFLNAFNEYTGKDVQFCRYFTKALFDRVESEFPNRFKYLVGGTNWGNDLRGMNMEDLPYHDRIFYSLHKYPWSNTGDERDWEESIQGIPIEKIILDEFSWREWLPDEVEWWHRFSSYLKKKGIRNSYYWTLSNSGDTGNLFQNDCQIFKLDNYLLLKSLYWEDGRRLRTRYDTQSSEGQTDLHSARSCQTSF